MFFFNGKVIFNVACPSLYPAHDCRRDAFPPTVSERSHGSVHKFLLLLFPFNCKMENDYLSLQDTNFA